MDEVETEISKIENEDELDILSEEEKKRKSKKASKKEKRRKEEQLAADLYLSSKAKQQEPQPLHINGLKNLKLHTLTQKIMGCIVGEHVTAEAPWTTISKVIVDENLYLHHDSSDFLPVKEDLAEYTDSTILVGYDSRYTPREDEDYHRFYIAVTESARNVILSKLEEERRQIEEKLKSSIYKTSLPWESLGSEREVNNSISSNTRPLIQLELETDIDELLKPVHFQDRNIEDAKDGYVRIGPGRQEFEAVPKLQIDASVQAVPALVTNIAQTDPGLPANAWTQYLYDMKTAQDLLSQDGNNILENGHTFPEYDYLEKSLGYNEKFDLYLNDYPLLVRDPADKEIPRKAVFEEYEAYADVNHCKNKLISSIAWHPMWSGIVALSYSVAVRCVTSTDIDLSGDEVHRDVFSKNYVLLWSFMDALKPRLILQSPREVHCLAWAPLDPNILVGGCASGQIIIWDLTGKLEAVEGNEYLTPEQQRYRLVMHSLISWLQPQPPPCYVRPAAVSNIQHSHAAKVTNIQWLSPYFEWNENGHYVKTAIEEGKTSMQLITSGEDGVVLVWDLNKTPEMEGGISRFRKKKIRKRPSALTSQISPFKIYDRRFRPIYILHPGLPPTKVSTKLTGLSLKTHSVQYELDSRRASTSDFNEAETSSTIDGKIENRKFSEIIDLLELKKPQTEKEVEAEEEAEAEAEAETEEEAYDNDFEDNIKSPKKEKDSAEHISETKKAVSERASSKKSWISLEDLNSDNIAFRKIYRPLLQSEEQEPPKVMHVTTDEGEFISFYWEGFDFHKGEQITTEKGVIQSWNGSVHDGPIVCCSRSPFLDDLILTVGGKVIALWKENLKNQPLFWKYCASGVTCGSWSPYRPCVFHIGRSDGSIEVWDLARNSDVPSLVQSISGKVLTAMAEHSLPLYEEKSVIGVADYNNSFRLLYFPSEYMTPLPDEQSILEDIVNREVQVRQTYITWNEAFIKSNAEELAKIKAKEEEAERKRQEVEFAQEQEALLRARQEEEEARLLAKGRQGNTLADRVLERLTQEREKQMQRVLMEKKRLNRTDLIAKQQPILIMKQMEKEKRKRQKEKIRQHQKIFDKTVVMLFPEIVEKPKEGPSKMDEFEAEFREQQLEIMKQYDELLTTQLNYIQNNPFNKRLKWEKVFEEGMFRRNVLDFPLFLRQKRKERYQRIYTNTWDTIPSATRLKNRKVVFKGASKTKISTSGSEGEFEGHEEMGDSLRENEYSEDFLTEEEKLVLKAGYSWQTEGGTYLPGGAVAVAHQFLRCVLHQLAPNGVFYQMFQSHIEDSARSEFFRSVAQALIDFNELCPSAPLQLLLETLNAKKTLTPDTVVVICKNIAAYMENLPLEAGPVQPGSPWLTLLAQMELFFRRIVLLLPSMDDVLAPLAVITSVFKCPGISSCKSILDPFSKILSFVIQNAVVESNVIVEVCQLCCRAFTRDREKQMLTRMVVIELVQALKFKTTMPDSNFMMLINFVIQDTGNWLIQNGFLSCAPETFSSGVNAAEIMRPHLSDALDFLADFHTVSKIKSFCQGDACGLNEDTLGGALKSGVAQYVAIEMARGTRDNRVVARHLPWLHNAPSSLQQGPREFLECMGHVRLLSWLLLGGLFQSLTGHAPCTPIPPEASCHVADHIQVIFAGFANQSKASVLHMSSLFHAFILCQLWTIYLEAGANSSPPGSEPHAAHNSILLDFWGKVTPCVLQLVAHSKILAEMVNLHFLNLLEALLEVNASILGKLMPLWSPVLFAHHVQLPGHMQVRLQNCRNYAPTNPTSNVLLAKWLHRLQFKMGQIELQSSAATQFYSV